MKKLFIIPFTFILIIACKNDRNNKSSEIDSLTTAQKIANVHGFEKWHKVKSFAFTFGGKKDDPQSGRSWVWNPKTNDISLRNGDETITFNRNNMDSTTVKIDKAFINDKFWALIPFQLIWDKGATISEKISAHSPVKNEVCFKITITYPNEGGYTPGDAYDIYFNHDYIIREWSYRKANSPEPTLSNTFENYKDFNGLLIAQEHKKSEGDWNLLLRNIKVELED